MSYYDQFGRRVQRPQSSSQGSPRGRHGGTPTIEDYVQLQEAFKALQAQHDAAQKDLAATKEALRQQTKTAIDLDATLRDVQAENERLQAALSAAEQQGQNEWQERYLRLQAEMDNLRKRLEQRSQQQAEESRLKILQDMLPLADHLEMALQHLPQAADEGQEEQIDGFRSSLMATRQAFLDTLARYGVKQMEPLGEPFDPEMHEAVGLLPSPETPEEHVAEVVQTGYQMKERLLRPARVMVSRGAPA